MFYKLMRVIVGLAFRIYLRKIYLNGVENIPEKGPFILTSNHPSAFMEACVLACFLPRSLHFLVRGDVFTNKKFLPFLKYTHQRPIYRARDGFENLRKNEQTFDFCHKALSEGKVVLIFPESRTILEKRLRPIQKGAAKLAFGAMDKYGIEDLQIIPVGVNFEDPRRFRSDAMVEIGTPIPLKEAYQRFRENPQETVSQVTKQIGDGLSTLVFHLPEKEQEDRFNEFESILRNELPTPVFPYPEESRFRFQRQIETAGQIRTDGQSSTWLDDLKSYHEKLRLISAQDIDIKMSQKSFLTRLFYFAGLPLWILGFLLLSWPGLIAWRITRKKVKDPSFIGPVTIGLGIAFYLITAILLFVILLLLMGWKGIVLFFLLFMLGYFVAVNSADYRSLLRLIRLNLGHRKTMQELIKLRQKIIAEGPFSSGSSNLRSD